MNEAADPLDVADNGSRHAPFDRNRLLPVADALAVAVAVALPWSTSASEILVWVWLVVFIPTLDPAALRRELRTPAGGLPVLLFVLALIGMLWAFGVPFKERFGGLSGYYKLLFIPLFMLHFRRSERAGWVITGYLATCGVLLAASWADLMFPSLLHYRHAAGVVVKDHIAQGGEFAACAMFLAPLALRAWTEGHRWRAAAIVLAAFCFVDNVIYIGTSRTGLATVAVLLALFAWKFLSWRARLGLLAAVAAAAALVWPFTRNLQTNVSSLIHEMRIYQPDAETTRTGERLVYWQKSMAFIAAAPLIGHGTGSIRDQFRHAAEGQTGMAAEAAANPHNQTFAVAIQLGLLGVAVLIAMWAAHLLLFWGGREIAAWFGLVVVTQNIVGSLFNSHLFDFTQGWSYVLGVGVAGGVMLASRRASRLVTSGSLVDD
jgi:O-antigen ligase